MDASLYYPLFLTMITILCVVTAFRYLSSTNYGLQMEKGTITIPFILSLVIIVWIGNRPVSGVYFGDTSSYALIYNRMEIGSVFMDWSKEWIWGWLLMLCKIIRLDVHGFFTVVEAGYVLSVLWAVKKFMPSNPMIGMLFVWSSLMYFTFGVNGLRNGLACHIILLAIAFLLEAKYLYGILLCLVAFGIHRSTILPIMGIAAAFIIRDVKYAIYFWLFSIPLSLVAGGAITSVFASLGFDDRMSGYTNIDNEMSQFSQSGFRWDFLLYSAMPVLMAWYVCIKRQVSDSWYNALCTVYCLCNAFWVIVIRSSFSNRFAYLSWFLYPIIIAYPLVNLAVWNDQDRKTGQILLAYCGFTVFMQLIYW